MAFACSAVANWTQTKSAALVTSWNPAGTSTPQSGTWYRATIVHTAGDGGTSGTATLSGAGVTWYLYATYKHSGNAQRQMSVFYALGDGGTLGSLTFTRGGTDNFNSATMVVEAITGVVMTGVGGVDAIVQAQSDVTLNTATPSVNITPTSSSNPLVASAGIFGGGYTATAGTGYTLVANPQVAANVSGATEYRATTDTNADLTWDGANNTVIAVMELALEPEGPTITTQPTAKTACVNTNITAFSTVTFTVAATTSGGTLVYDWELETSVGGGVYANVSSGSGVTWAGGTTASCSATVTATTLTGRRVRCNVSDDNGTVTTNAVALTIYDGPEGSTSSGTTNGSGVFTSTEDCDIPMDTASFPGDDPPVIRYTMTVDGETVETSGVSIAP